MIVYIAFASILVIIAFLGRICKQSCLLYYVILFLIAVFTAMRNGIGVDTASYQNIYNQVLYGYTGSSHAEIGYIYINKIAAILNSPYVVVQFMTVCLSLTFLHAFVTYGTDKHEWGFALIVFLCSNLYLSYYCSGVRQGIAVSICLFSSRYIINRQFLKFLMVIGCAMLFHKSAICFIPGYFIYRKKIKLKYIIAACVVAYLLAPYVKICFDIAIGHVTGHYMGYAKLFNGDANAKSGLGVIARVLIWLAVVLFAHRSIKPDQTKKIIFLNLFIFGVCLYLLNSKVDILNRINEYYLGYLIVVFTYIFNAFRSNSKPIVYIISCCLILGLFMSFILFVKDAFIPYKMYVGNFI